MIVDRTNQVIVLWIFHSGETIKTWDERYYKLFSLENDGEEEFATLLTIWVNFCLEMQALICFLWIVSFSNFLAGYLQRGLVFEGFTRNPVAFVLSVDPSDHKVFVALLSPQLRQEERSERAGERVEICCFTKQQSWMMDYRSSQHLILGSSFWWVL